MKFAYLIGGIVLSPLGALWLVQGLGLVTMEPLLCFANCTPLVGPELSWAVAGLVALLCGLVAIRLGTRQM